MTDVVITLSVTSRGLDTWLGAHTQAVIGVPDSIQSILDRIIEWRGEVILDIGQDKWIEPDKIIVEEDNIRFNWYADLGKALAITFTEKYFGAVWYGFGGYDGPPVPFNDILQWVIDHRPPKQGFTPPNKMRVLQTPKEFEK